MKCNVQFSTKKNATTIKKLIAILKFSVITLGKICILKGDYFVIQHFGF